MSFYQRYQLKRLVEKSESQTFSGTENQTGRPVFLHMLEGDAAKQLRPLVARLMRAPLISPVIIETGDFAGSYYVVTDPIEPFNGFRSWLELRVSDLARADMPEPEQTGAGTEATRAARFIEDVHLPASRDSDPAEITPAQGEFTRFFGAGAPPEHAGRAAVPEPGEFTRLFGAPVAPRPQQTDIGEFSDIFDPPPAAAPPISDPIAKPQLDAWPAERSQTGEFTKFFGSSIPAEHIDVESEQARHASLLEQPDARPFQQAGEFTRVFGSGELGNKVVQPVPQRPEELLASGMFRRDQLGADTPAQDDEGNSVGDYTRVIRGDDKVEAANSPNGASVSMPAAQSTRKIGIIIGGVLGILLLAILLYLAISRA